MNRAEEILAAVRLMGADLEVVDGKIRYEGPPEALTDDLRADVREHADAIAFVLEGGFRTAAHLTAAICDLGCWFVLRDSKLGIRRHEGVEPLPDWLMAEIGSRATEIGEFMRKPISEYTELEREAMGLSETFGLDWLGWAESQHRGK